MQYRTRRLGAATVTLALAAGVLGATSGGADAAATVVAPPAPPAGTAARVGPPQSMVVLGDSISKATGSSGGGVDGGIGAERPANSWATGTASGLNSNFQRIRALPGGTSVTALNLAANGANMRNNFLAQAQSVPVGTEYVMIEMGGNDLCRPSEAEMTTEADYRARFRAGLDWLKANRPDTIVFVASIPDIYNLWYVRGSAHAGEVFGGIFGIGGTAVPGPRAARDSTENSNKNSARFFWDGIFGSLIPCQSLLVDPSNPRNAGPTPTPSHASEARRLRVRARNIAFNAILEQECGLMLRCRFDNRALFNFSSNRDGNGLLQANKANWAFVDSDISTQDHFHPSFSGQKKLAENTFAASYNFTDTTAPAVSLTASPPANADGWNAGSVTVTVTATDTAGVRGVEYRTRTGSGTSSWTPVIGNSTVTITVAAAGITHVEARALDVNGNQSTSVLRTVAIDTTSPQTALVTPAEGARYEQHAAITADYSCADAAGGAGLATCVGTVADGADIDTDTVGVKTFSVTATDGAGNTTTVSRSYEVIDVTPPTIDLRSPASGEPFARRAHVAADYSCADEMGGSGVRQCDGTVADGGVVPTSSIGDHTFTVNAGDHAGNTATATHTYTVVDVTSPTIAITSPSDGAVYAHRQPVGADYSCVDDDGGSGVDPAYCVGSVPTGANVDTTTLGKHIFTVEATDLAGNNTTVTQTYTVIDVTAPTVASSNSGIQYELGSTVAAQFTCTDEAGGSGIARCIGPATLDTSSIGLKSYDITTEDQAGNSRTLTISYTVIYAYGEVRQPINPDGSSVFRRGSTLPVKFALTDAGGNPVGTAVATLSYGAGNGELLAGDPVEESTSTAAATTGNRFRWDAASQQYVFNLSTRSMVAGTYRLIVDLDDGTRYTAVITLK